MDLDLAVRRVGGIAAIAVLVGVLGGCTSGADSTSAPGSTGSGPAATAAETPLAPIGAPLHAGERALTVLAAMAVKGRAPKTGYSRAEFGAAWTDANNDPLGHNGCDTRNDILRRDLTAVVSKPGTHGCVALTGTLRDPYTGRVIQFRRAAAIAVQIDHVVALSNSWQTGAQQLSAAQRIDLANDPLELIAVDGPTNERKGDGDAATWLPPQRSFRCDYVARQLAVKATYHLWVTAAEHDAMTRVLATCPTERVPKEVGARAIALPVQHPGTPTPIQGGRFCRQALYGQSANDAAGHRYVCAGDTVHPRWQQP